MATCADRILRGVLVALERRRHPSEPESAMLARTAARYAAREARRSAYGSDPAIVGAGNRPQKGETLGPLERQRVSRGRA